MRVVVQRVSSATARRDHEVVAAIDEGLVAFVGIARDDDQETAQRMARKLAHLRVFEVAGSTFGRSILDHGGEALVLAQFTLCADTSRGRRPNFSHAAAPDAAHRLLDDFAQTLEHEGVSRVVRGPFGGRLAVEVHNWGPFTVVLDS
jgi:D-tyrosyl-tRNA(Tyr) deacylase